LERRKISATGKSLFFLLLTASCCLGKTVRIKQERQNAEKKTSFFNICKPTRTLVVRPGIKAPDYYQNSERQFGEIRDIQN
jgi:hypothetical protein